MKPLLLSLVILFGMSGLATSQSLNEFEWKSRLVILFTPEPGDPLFSEQVRLLYTQNDEFLERDVKFLFITPDGNHENTGRFLDESLSRQYYEKFAPKRYEFTLVLIGLDGNEKFRATNRLTPPSILTNMIDGMPMRQRELLEGRGNKSLIGEEENTVPAGKRRDF